MTLWDINRGTRNVWLSIADLLNGEDGVVYDSKEYVSDKGAADCKLVRKGTLLVSFKLTLGRLAFAGRNLYTNEAIAALTILDNKKIVPEFLFYCLRLFDWDKASEGEDKIKGKTLNKAKLKEIIVEFPSIPEQQRIVAFLDDAFERIDRAVANTEKNLANTRELFESSLQAIFNRQSEAWDELTLEMLLQRGWIESHLDGNHGSDYPRKEEFISTGVPYISANCLTDDRVDMTRAKYLAPDRAALLRKGIAKDNDVLFAHNATVGPVSILRTDQPKVILGTSLTYYRCNPNHIIPEYLAHYMRSFAFKKQYLQIMRQSTRNQVPITQQREFLHVIPPISEQQVIVKQLDVAFERSAQLGAIYATKLKTLVELKQSILQRAFAGELTAHPEKALPEAAE